ncbi:MAG: hypothetical protein HY861_04405 [Chlamydiia bacterium]|nr:hypothetical protein [Chlamydiia bacterium]
MKRPSKRLWYLTLLFPLFLLLLPQILSTPLGKPLFERSIGRRLGSQIKIDSLSLSWFGPQMGRHIYFVNTEVEGTVEEVLSYVPLWSLSQMGSQFSLKNGEATFSLYKGNKIEQINIGVINHKIQASAVAEKGDLTLSGIIHSKTEFDLVANLINIPTAPFDYLLHAQGMLHAALGQTMNLSGNFLSHQREGILSFDLLSPNTQLSMNGSIVEGHLLLAAPLTLRFILTPEFSAKIAPSLNLAAKKPLTLRIEKEGTLIPLHPFSLSALNINSALFDAGQLTCKNSSALISLLTLLHDASLSSTASIWCAPVIFSIDKGSLHLSRLDALINRSIHLCTWGTMDLMQEELFLYLGVPAETLQYTLGIQHLAPNYVLKIPIRGHFKDPEFNIAPAAAQIAALLAGQQISKKSGIFGGLIDLFSKPSEDSDVPPSRRPFPWESQNP